MDTHPTIGPIERLTLVIGPMAKAVSERAGKSPQIQSLRSMAAIQTVMDFQPRDAVEAMLAGHCVMFHEIIVDSVRSALGGDEAADLDGIVAMDKAFGNNLTRLERYRRASASGAADARTETRTADRVRRRQTESPDLKPAASVEAAPEGGNTVLPDAAPEMFTAYPEPDPARPAECPAPDAAQIAGLNRQARRHLARQSRKRPASASPRTGLSPTQTVPATKAFATAAG